MKHLMSGNEATARGVYEAGIKVCSAYPGTPSTEILENLPQYGKDVYCEWAPNEKVATEVAYGAAVAGSRAFCTMKMVGLNVAADPLFTAGYMGVNGAYIVVTADDPSCHSSQNEQDNRHYARAAKIAMVEPSDAQECKDFVKLACEISEEFDTPVLYRTTTRVCHSKGLVEFGERVEHVAPAYARNTRKYICAPANAYLNHPIVEERLVKLAEYGCTRAVENGLNKVELGDGKVGVITASISYQYAKEVFPEGTSFLKLGLTYPLPMDLIRDFAGKVEKLYVIEELDPFMEDEIKAAGIECVGKELTGKLYELNPQLLRERIRRIEEQHLHGAVLGPMAALTDKFRAEPGRMRGAECAACLRIQRRAAAAGAGECKQTCAGRSMQPETCAIAGNGGFQPRPERSLRKKGRNGDRAALPRGVLRTEQAGPVGRRGRGIDRAWKVGRRFAALAARSCKQHNRRHSDTYDVSDLLHIPISSLNLPALPGRLLPVDSYSIDK